MQLGDFITTALSSIGLSSERLERWLNCKCNCDERRQRLNAVGAWARRVLTGKTDNAADYLDRLVVEQSHSGLKE